MYIYNVYKCILSLEKESLLGPKFWRNETWEKYTFSSCKLNELFLFMSLTIITLVLFLFPTFQHYIRRNQKLWIIFSMTVTLSPPKCHPVLMIFFNSVTKLRAGSIPFVNNSIQESLRTQSPHVYKSTIVYLSWKPR